MGGQRQQGFQCDVATGAVGDVVHDERRARCIGQCGKPLHESCLRGANVVGRRHQQPGDGSLRQFFDPGYGLTQVVARQTHDHWQGAGGGQHRIQHRQLLMFIQGRRFTSGAADYKTIYAGRCVVLNQTGEGGVVYGVARKRCDQRNPETREIARARHVV